MTIETDLAVLTAGLAEDERVARAATASWNPSPAGDEWEAFAGEVEEELLVALRPGLPRPPDVMSGMWGALWEYEPEEGYAGSAMPVFTHAAQHDPARVLNRYIPAIRKVIAEHQPDRDADGSRPYCLTCSELSPYNPHPVYQVFPCPTIQALAGIYTRRRHRER